MNDHLGYDACKRMEVVRRNALLLERRLENVGWEPLYGAMVGEPAPEHVPGIAEARELGVPELPEELMAFWKIVGSLNFVWNYKSDRDPPEILRDTSLFDLDPLCIDGPDALTYLLETWTDMVAEERSSQCDSIILELAPDNYHKANISGGSPYGVSLPADCDDPMFSGDMFSMRFTDYLRLGMNWAGFPGLANCPPTPEIAIEVQKLTADFERF